MKIEMDKKYKTRDGRAVRILCIDSENPYYPVVALVGNDCDQRVEYYTSEGVFNVGNNSLYDLLESTPYDDFEIDEPVMVKNDMGVNWDRRYFAGLNDDNEPTTFNTGTTSWSVGKFSTSAWDECRRPTKEELEG